MTFGNKIRPIKIKPIQISPSRENRYSESHQKQQKHYFLELL